MGIWNPAKVLPEVLLPIVGLFSAYVVSPITGDYILSFTYTSAFFVSVFCTLMFMTVYKFFARWFVDENIIPLVLTSLMVIIHFGLFKSNSVDNQYMLLALNFTCYFHYVIPNLLNAGIVIVLMSYENINIQWARSSYFTRGIIISILYFAIFSNIFTNSILTIYCMAKILIAIAAFSRAKGKGIRDFCKLHFLEIGIVFCWILACIFEISGGRAAQIGGKVSYFHLPLKATIDIFIGLLKTIYYPYIIAGFALCFIFLYQYLYKKNDIDTHIKEKLIILVIASILEWLYLILVSAKANPGYASLVQCMYGVFFYLSFMGIILLAIFLKEHPKFTIVLPLFLLCLISITTNGNKCLRDSNISKINGKQAMAVSNYLVEQIKYADIHGQKEMELIVPKGDNIDNWPHPMYMGSNISRTLFVHGQISKKIVIKIVPNQYLNKIFYY
jgi:hypothetical protein